jgi:hypothetical protein
MAKSPPKAPDYEAAAQAQAQSSREVTEQQTWANRPDQVTPWGTETWTNEAVWDPTTNQNINRWTQNTALNEQSQQALDAQLAMTNQRSQLALSLGDRMRNEYGQAMDWQGFTPLGQAPTAPNYQTPGAMQGPAQAQQYDTQGLNAFGTGPTQGQYTPEQIQRGLDTSGLQQLDPSQRYNQQAGDAVYQQWAERAQPAQQMATDQLRTQLYNAGLKEGDQAYDAEMNKLRMTQGDAQRQAAFQATQMAGQEASRMYGMDQSTRQQQFGELQQGGQFVNAASQQALQQQLGIGGQRYNESLGGGNYANQLRQQQLGERVGMGQQNYQNQQAFIDAQNQQRAQGLQEQMTLGQQNFQNAMTGASYQNTIRQQEIAEAMQQRGFSLNEINALLTGQQVGMPSMPGFQNAQRSEGVQSLQAAQMTGQAELDRYNAQQQATQGMMSGITSMAGSMMPMSSRAVKKRIRRIGETKGGTPIYSFQYIWGGPMQIGVMADEAPPEAVVNIDGAIYVDYSKVT